MSYQHFKKLCDDAKVRPSDVSRATGVATSTLTEWKKGSYTPKADKLQKIADYFGVSVDYLLSGEEQEGYYTNPETAEMAQKIFENKDLRLLFDAAADASPEDLQIVHQMLLALKKKETPEYDNPA